MEVASSTHLGFATDFSENKEIAPRIQMNEEEESQLTVALFNL